MWDDLNKDAKLLKPFSDSHFYLSSDAKNDE